VALRTHPHRGPTSRISRVIPLLPSLFVNWHVTGRLLPLPHHGNSSTMEWVNIRDNSLRKRVGFLLMLGTNEENELPIIRI